MSCCLLPEKHSLPTFVNKTWDNNRKLKRSINEDSNEKIVKSIFKKDKKRKLEKEPRENVLSVIPDELFYMGIFSFLEFETLSKCSLVCKKWFNVVGQTATTIHHDTIIKMLKNTKHYCSFVASACKHFNNIYELTLHDCGMINMFNERDNLYLETVMGNLNNIRKLEIHGLRITDNACHQFSKSPKPFLTELRLDHCMISDSGFAVLSKNNTIENVSILSVTTSAIDIESCQELSKLKHLKYVDFSNNCIDKMGAIHLAHSLSNVEYLDLSFNNIEEGFEQLCEKRNVNLKKLVIIGNNIPGSACKNIQNLENLTFLDMSGNPLGHDGASFLGKGLKNIITLKLSDSKINSTAMVYLSEGVMNNLIDLSLEGNFFGDEGCLVFQSPMFAKLRKLKLNRNCITCFGCEHLACENLKNVEELNLSFNRIKSRGVKFLSEARFENLENLNLTSNFIPPQAAIFLKSPVFSKLKVLFMMGNRNTTSSTLETLTQILPNLQLRDF